MDVDVDVYLTRDDTGQNPLTEYVTEDRDHEPSRSPLMRHVPDKFDFHTSETHSSLVIDGDDIAAHEVQSTIDSFKEPSDTQTADAEKDHENNRPDPPSNNILLIPKEAPSSEHRIAHAKVSDSEGHTTGHPLGPLLLSIIDSATFQTEREPDPDERLDCVQPSGAELGHIGSAGLAHLSDEEEKGEIFDDPCDDISSSAPPSSSPPQVFSSPPCASSQSSASDMELTKMVLVSTVEADVANSHDCPHGGQQLLPAEDGSCSESENLRGGDIDIDGPIITPSSQTNACSSDHHLGHFGRQRSYRSDPDNFYESQPAKRPKRESSSNYLPPAPKRATLASQHRQFKKLTTPFRPPKKIPVVTDGPVRTTNDAKPTMCSPIELNQDNHEPRGPTTHAIPLQHKASNTPKSISQFKSPLVNRVLPADARTIRLTPAVQALERKLQLLKRAVKVKEENEEVVLVQLAGKWIEAGREVAYEVWDAIKDAGNLEGGNVTSARRSYGWENTDQGNVPWGWDNKPGDAGEEAGDRDPSETSYVAGRSVPEDDDDHVGSNTLGTMLRQLGIAPEIFGWDEEMETFTG